MRDNSICTGLYLISKRNSAINLPRSILHVSDLCMTLALFVGENIDYRQEKSQAYTHEARRRELNFAILLPVTKSLDNPMIYIMHINVC